MPGRNNRINPTKGTMTHKCAVVKCEFKNSPNKCIAITLCNYANIGVMIWNDRKPNFNAFPGFDHTRVIYRHQGRPDRATLNEGEAYRRITG